MAARPLELGDVGVRLAAEVAAHRQRHGWDQAELAARVSDAGRPMSPSVLGKVEAGARRVDVDDLAALARALEVEPSELLGDLKIEGRKRVPAGPVEASVRDDLDALGELAELDGMAPALAQIAFRLAREMDYGGGEGGKTLHSLAKELRATLAELRSLSPEEPPDDDDLGDLAAPA
ncbi:helix-turn-helix transcriptional regulator [Streptomyces sp. NPDC001586]|uniref:helix-turn-helix domain-containing protein n=1 Tax=Streptomyces sp. NPDC001586 TaxID=3154387 RepID=UPI003323D11D